MKRGWRSAFAWAVFGLAPATAAAGDGIRPRTVVIWPEPGSDRAPCSITVERATDPIAHLPYDIAAEDPPAGTSITDDEVADGRRHQFFAFSSDIDPRITMPEWITLADVMAAADKGLVDPMMVAPDDMLEAHAVLADTFVRIDADDARRPITFAAADAGVDWDTTGLATGAWIVRAYTWDPWPNRWADPRPGVIAVADDADPGSHAPAHAVDATNDVLYRDDVGVIEGCLAAMDGTTVTGEWAFFDDPDSAFEPFAVDVPVDGDAFDLAFVPPEPVWGRFAVIRVTATDPLDRDHIAYVPRRITVLASDRPQDCDPIADNCATSSGTGSESTDGDAPDATSLHGDEGVSTSGDVTSSAPAEDAPVDTSGGCSCAADHEVDSLVLVVLTGFTFAGSRRRRRDASRPRERWNDDASAMHSDRGRVAGSHRSAQRVGRRIRQSIGQYDGLRRAAGGGRRPAVARER